MKIATIVGARPQFIKASTISRAILAQSGISEVLIHTGQHYDANMSDVFFTELDIRKPDHHLGIGGGTHGENTGRMLEAIEKVLIAEKPDWVLVYGDTDSTLAGALAAAKLNIPLAHVEAGLRSFNRRMPEEINRVLTDHASDLLFVPTQTAAHNLSIEGITGDKVKWVGDVMFDATLFYRDRARKPEIVDLPLGKPFFLCTIHRVENTDDRDRLSAIVRLLNELAKDMTIVLPLHPRTFAAIQRLAIAGFSSAIKTIEPVGYLEMSWLLANCSLVITDSGGLQKEAFFHQKPCVTLRNETEWVELVEAGYNRLISPQESNLLEIFPHMQAVAIPKCKSFYGDGQAAAAIVTNLLFFKKRGGANEYLG
jgi:UDP-GlcNAc3NAcA epimerase